MSPSVVCAALRVSVIAILMTLRVLSFHVYLLLLAELNMQDPCRYAYGGHRCVCRTTRLPVFHHHKRHLAMERRAAGQRLRHPGRKRPRRCRVPSPLNDHSDRVSEHLGVAGVYAANLKIPGVGLDIYSTEQVLDLQLAN